MTTEVLFAVGEGGGVKPAGPAVFPGRFARHNLVSLVPLWLNPFRVFGVFRGSIPYQKSKIRGAVPHIVPP